MAAMAKNLAPCMCSADFCGHPAGERCSKPVKFTVKTQTLINNEQYGPERGIGICESCWANIEKHLPFMFGPDR